MKQETIFSVNTKRPQELLDYIKLCFPILLFPVMYFPYALWWRGKFSTLAAKVIRGLNIPSLQFMLTGNNPILLFWGIVTFIAMLAAVVISILRIRPWYAIPLYLAVMFSLCGICSLTLYTIILR